MPSRVDSDRRHVTHLPRHRDMDWEESLYDMGVGQEMIGGGAGPKHGRATGEGKGQEELVRQVRVDGGLGRVVGQQGVAGFVGDLLRGLAFRP